MRQRSWLLAGALAASLLACAWLFADNRALRRELEVARGTPAARAIADASAPAEQTPGPSRRERARQALRWLGAGSRATPGERPALPEVPDETRAERRQRRQAELLALFGRLDGESAEDYRARMAPFVSVSLAGPRHRMAEARRAAEDAAGVTDGQRTELDAVFQDVYQEAIDLTNRALAAGDLTPYSRNWSGVLNLAGGMGAILEGAEGRITRILSADQMRALYDQGFEWGEYLGVTVPWENLDPPPPPPGS